MREPFFFILLSVPLLALLLLLIFTHKFYFLCELMWTLLRITIIIALYYCHNINTFQVNDQWQWLFFCSCNSISRSAALILHPLWPVDGIVFSSEKGNVIGGWYVLANGRQTGKQSSKLIFCQNIVQTIVFIEREKVHTINILEFKMEQLIE